MDEHAKTRSDEDTVKILIATDNHLGYMERDPVRGNDSFVTFEEILQLAKLHQVDMVLLGGDMFHENKPSRQTMYKTIELLRKYCLGDRPVGIEILSDQSNNFHTKFGCVNFEDPNYNVEIPVFSIHGNHDDPAGDGRLAALDLLSVCNLVNYFGKSDNIDDITVYPILLRKGTTKLAIYGLGNVRDERLYRTFQQKKVKMMRPTEDKDSWFNILVLHQNRVAHTPTNFIHESMLDNFLDFVIWGHEHECLIVPQPSSIGEFYITQPGSSVATALSDGESKKKHVGLLKIYNSEFRLTPIPLQTVRPFIMEDVVLSSEELDPNDHDSVVDFLATKVEEMIQKASTEYPNASKLKPLIRLKVDYTGFSTINPQRFGQRFVGRVANPNDILLFSRRRKTTTSVTKKGAKDVEKDMIMRALKPEPMETIRIEDLIESFLSDAAKALEILPENELHNAVQFFVEKDDKNAIGDFVLKTLQQTRKYLVSEDPDKTVQPETIQAIITERTAAKRIEHQSTKKPIAMDIDDDDIDVPKRKFASSDDEQVAVQADEDEEEEEEEKPKKTKTKGKKSTAKKATEKKTTSKRGRRSKSNFEPLQIDEGKPSSAIIIKDEDDEDIIVKPKSTSKKTTSKKSTAAAIVDEEEQLSQTATQDKKKRRITSIMELLPSKKTKTEEDSQNSVMVTDEPSSSMQDEEKLSSKWGRKKT